MDSKWNAEFWQMTLTALRINLIALHMMNHIEGLGKKVADLSSFGKQFLTRYYKAKKVFETLYSSWYIYFSQGY